MELLGLGAIQMAGLLFFVLIGIILTFFRWRSGGGGVLVLRRFVVRTEPSADIHVEIVGRAQGLIGFLLTLAKISPESTLTVRKTDATLDAVGLMGRRHTFVPLTQAQGSRSGYERPFLLLLISIFFLLNSLVGVVMVFSQNQVPPQVFVGLLGMLLIAVVSGWAFLFRRTLLLSIGSGGYWTAMRFKRSILENQSVDLDQLIQVSDFIDQLILRAQATGTPSLPPVAVAASSTRCPKCGSENPSGARFCENCGAGI